MTDERMDDFVHNVMLCRDDCKRLLATCGFTPSMKDYDKFLDIAKMAYAVGVSNVIDGIYKVGETSDE